ncbi:MAG: DUF1674 domain-containing protein [Methylococcaceae bacterium]
MQQKQSNENSTEIVHPKPATSDTQVDLIAVEEFGVSNGLEPTRYGDWEKNGRCVDF